MNELEIRKESKDIYDFSQKVVIQNVPDLANAVVILKGIKKHKKKVTDYWRQSKESAKKTLADIMAKEKEMLSVCDTAEKEIKAAIIVYKKNVDTRTGWLNQEARANREQEIKKLLEAAKQAERSGDNATALYKNDQAQLIACMGELSSKESLKVDGLTLQKRWNVEIIDEKAVPAYFGGTEIRQIKTGKLLDIRRSNPNVQIPGVKFFQRETVAIRDINS